MEGDGGDAVAWQPRESGAANLLVAPKFRQTAPSPPAPL